MYNDENTSLCNEPMSKPLMGRKCNFTCEIPENWAMRVYKTLQFFKPVYEFKNLQNNILQFETCKNCMKSFQMNGTKQCNNITSCLDNIRYLNSLDKHYQGLRTISRKIYEIRSILLNLIKLENSLLEEPLEFINAHTKFESYFEGTTNAANNETNLSNTIVRPQFIPQIQAFRDDLKKKLEYFPCIVCYKKFNKINLVTLTELQMSNQLLLDSDPIKHSNLICRNFCYESIFKQSKPSLYSKLNNMHLDPMPPEIQKLNFYEKLLVQRGKAFLSTVSLRPLSGSDKFNGIKALKGCAIHLPIEFEATNNYVVNTLPSAEALNFLVYGLPTITNNIWRGLVDLDAVYDVLNLLTSPNYNPLYKDITLNDVRTKQQNDLLFKTIETNGDLNLFQKMNPYLEQLKNFQNLNQYTVIETEKCNLNFAEIEKYSMQKIVSEPFKDNERLMDMLCFVDVYPRGRGGIYDHRPIGKVLPAMFLRWQILHANSTARRNVQYLLSCLHNKDIRAVNQGIFASLQTTAMPNLTANQLLDHIQSKDRKLEANLSTTLNHVRGSKEYWSLRRTDLRLFDEYFGPATIYFTLSCNEYDWEELHAFLIQQNSDLNNLNNLTFEQLREIDPVSVSIFYEKKLKSCLNHLVLNKNSPFGKVNHHFYRREYQARGTPHCHGKLWIEGAPVYGTSSDEEVIKYIDENITCRLPDPIKEPNLYRLVTKYQIHRCGPSCLKLRGKNKFNFLTYSTSVNLTSNTKLLLKVNQILLNIKASFIINVKIS